MPGSSHGITVYMYADERESVVHTRLDSSYHSEGH